MTSESENMAIASTLAAVPPTEVVARATRRTFSIEYQNRILAEIDQAGHGKMGAILRREGIYSHTITQWRKKRRQALAAVKRGPKVDPELPLRKENERLQRKIQRLEHRLMQTDKIMEVQKKVSEILGITFPENDYPMTNA